MGAKGEISWKRRGEYGERMEYYARNERGVWKFFQRERRFEKWESYAEPEFDDWRWVSYWYPLNKVVDFKQDVYRRALAELATLTIYED